MNFCLLIALFLTFVLGLSLPRKFLLFLLPSYFFSGILLSENLNITTTFPLKNCLQALYLHQPELLSQFFYDLCLILLSLKISTSLNTNNATSFKRTNYKLFLIFYLLEFLALSIFATLLFKIPWLEAFLLSFVVIAPFAFLNSRQNTPADQSFNPIPWSQLISFIGIALTLTILSSSMNDPLSLLLVKCLINLFLGIPLGHFTAKIFVNFSNVLSKNSFVVTLIIIGLALLMQKNEIAKISFFLVPISLISFGYTISKLDANLNKSMAESLEKIWQPFLLILFFLVGLHLSLDFLFGKIGIFCFLMIILSMTIRFLSTLCLLKSAPISKKEKLLQSLTSLNKGEVQATIYGLTMTLFFNSKLWLFNGAFITDLLNTATAFSIVVTFPILIILNKFYQDK